MSLTILPAFTQRLHKGDLVVQPYGMRYSVARWGAVYYDHFEVRDTHPCRENANFTLRFSEGAIEVYQRKN